MTRDRFQPPPPSWGRAVSTEARHPDSSDLDRLGRARGRRAPARGGNRRGLELARAEAESIAEAAGWMARRSRRVGSFRSPETSRGGAGPRGRQCPPTFGTEPASSPPRRARRGADAVLRAVEGAEESAPDDATAAAALASGGPADRDLRELGDPIRASVVPSPARARAERGPPGQPRRAGGRRRGGGSGDGVATGPEIGSPARPGSRRDRRPRRPSTRMSTAATVGKPRQGLRELHGRPAPGLRQALDRAARIGAARWPGGIARERKSPPLRRRERSRRATGELGARGGEEAAAAAGGRVRRALAEGASGGLRHPIRVGVVAPLPDLPRSMAGSPRPAVRPSPWRVASLEPLPRVCHFLRRFSSRRMRRVPMSTLSPPGSAGPRADDSSKPWTQRGCVPLSHSKEAGASRGFEARGAGALAAYPALAQQTGSIVGKVTSPDWARVSRASPSRPKWTPCLGRSSPPAPATVAIASSCSLRGAIGSPTRWTAWRVRGARSLSASTPTASVAMAPTAIEESIQVIGETLFVDPSSAEIKTSIGNEVIEARAGSVRAATCRSRPPACSTPRA